MAQPQTPSQSRAEWNRAVYLYSNSWTSFFLYCCLTPLAGQKMVCTRNDGNLFNLARLWAETKVRKVLIREILFADDAALTAHNENALQRLIITFALTCSEFGLTISHKKTNILGQDVGNIPSISIDHYTLEVVEDFTYLGSTISNNLSPDTELNKRVTKQSSTGTSPKEGLGQSHVDHQHQDEGVPRPECSAPCCMVARPGPSIPAKSAHSTPSTCVASEGFWASPGETESQTRMS